MSEQSRRDLANLLVPTIRWNAERGFAEARPIVDQGLMLGVGGFQIVGGEQDAVRALAKELGPEILVNAICPGVIETELGNSITRARGPELARGIALQRLGKPADVANIVAFLAASEPCFITGQDFVVDGFQYNV